MYTGIVQVSRYETTVKYRDSVFAGCANGGTTKAKHMQALTENQINVQTGIHEGTIWMLLLLFGATLARTANSKLHHNLAKSVSSHKTIKR